MSSPIVSAPNWPRRTPSTRAQISPSDVSIREVSSPSCRRNRSTSRVAAMKRPARREHQHEEDEEDDEGEQRQDEEGLHRVGRRPRVPARLPQPARARRAARRGGGDLEQVADHDEIGELGDRGVGIAVHRDDRLRGLHPDLVLDGAADPEREVELRLDDLARLTDLLGVRDPARVHCGARRPDGATELRRQLLDDPEALRPTHAAAARDDDPSLLDRGRDRRGRHAVDDRHQRQSQLADGIGRLDRSGPGCRLGGHDVRPDRHDAALPAEPARGVELAAEDAHLDDRTVVPGHGRGVDETPQPVRAGDDAGHVATLGAGTGEEIMQLSRSMSAASR
jgi:hypothetical protein